MGDTEEKRRGGAVKNRICGTDVVLALIGVGTLLFIQEGFEVFALTGAGRAGDWILCFCDRRSSDLLADP